MFERGVCIFVAIISLFGVFYSSKNMDVYSDVSYAARSNYVDVYFTNVESSNSSKVSLTPSRRSLQMDSISLSRAGEEEVIRYELFNNSFNKKDLENKQAKSLKENIYKTLQPLMVRNIMKMNSLLWNVLLLEK